MGILIYFLIKYMRCLSVFADTKWCHGVSDGERGHKMLSGVSYGVKGCQMVPRVVRLFTVLSVHCGECQIPTDPI